MKFQLRETHNMGKHLFAWVDKDPETGKFYAEVFNSRGHELETVGAATLEKLQEKTAAVVILLQEGKA